MPFINVDDGFYDNPKIKSVGLDGAGLLVSLMTWSSKHLTDGVVPEQVIRELCGHPKRFHTLLQRLLHQKCLHRVPGGTTKRYRIHDYLEWNDSAEVVKARRAAAKEKKRIQRLRAQGLGPDGRPLGTTRDSPGLSPPTTPHQSVGNSNRASDVDPGRLDAAAVDVVQALARHGVSEDVATELAVSDLEECKRQLDWIRLRQPSKNPAGMLVQSVREAWARPTEPPREGREYPDVTEKRLRTGTR